MARGSIPFKPPSARCNIFKAARPFPPFHLLLQFKMYSNGYKTIRS